MSSDILDEDQPQEDGFIYAASSKQQQNISKLKEHSDFLSSFMMKNQLYIQNNPSISSEIMQTPLRQSNKSSWKGESIDVSKGPSLESSDLAQSMRYQDYAKKEESFMKRDSFQYQERKKEQQERVQKYDSGEKVISTIDNVFDKIREKYKFESSPIKELLENNQSLMKETFIEQNNSLSIDNKSLELGSQQKGILLDYDSNADSIVQRIRNKIMLNMFERMNRQDSSETSDKNGVQQLLDEKQKKLEITTKFNQIIKENNTNTIDKQNIENEITRIKENLTGKQVQEVIKTDISLNSNPTKDYIKEEVVKKESQPLKQQSLQELRRERNELAGKDTKKQKKTNVLHRLYSSDEEEDDNQERKVKIKKNVTVKEDKKRSQKQEDEEDGMKDLERIQANKTNLKENIKKLKLLYQNNFDTKRELQQPLINQKEHDKSIERKEENNEENEIINSFVNQQSEDGHLLNYSADNHSLYNSFLENSVFQQGSPSLRKNSQFTSPVLNANNPNKVDILDSSNIERENPRILKKYQQNGFRNSSPSEIIQNNSNLSYSQSINGQHSFVLADTKKYDDSIPFRISEENEDMNDIYLKDGILQQLLIEKTSLEEELLKWQRYLQKIDEESH